MAFCINCGSKLNPEGLFCASCGHPVGEVPEGAGAGVGGEGAAGAGAGAGVGGEGAAGAGTAGVGAAGATDAAGAGAAGAAIAGAANQATGATEAAQTTAHSAAEFEAQLTADTGNVNVAAAKPAPSKKVAVIAACAAVALIAVIAVAVWIGLSGSNPVKTDQLKDELKETSFVQNGSVSSNYTYKSSYEITDLSITDQTKSKYDYGDGDKGVDVTVTFEGTMQNDSFQTSFTGHAYYIYYNKEWVLQEEPSVTATESKPLKGVDMLEITESIEAKYAADSSFDVSDFECTFEENDGNYTCVASRVETYNMWFATDTATAQLEFTFDEKSGWVPKDDISLSNQNTEWKLAGKTFAYDSSYALGLFSDSNHTKGTTASITFTESDDPSVLTANYRQAFEAPESGAYVTYYSFDESGSASGTPIHEFGSDSFKVVLKPTDGHTTIFDCTSSYVYQTTNSKTYSLYVDIDSDNVYKEIDVFTANTYTADFSSATFVLQD